MQQKCWQLNFWGPPTWLFRCVLQSVSTCWQKNRKNNKIWRSSKCMCTMLFRGKKRSRMRIWHPFWSQALLKWCILTPKRMEKIGKKYLKKIFAKNIIFLYIFPALNSSTPKNFKLFWACFLPNFYFEPTLHKRGLYQTSRTCLQCPRTRADSLEKVEKIFDTNFAPKKTYFFCSFFPALTMLNQTQTKSQQRLYVFRWVANRSQCVWSTGGNQLERFLLPFFERVRSWMWAAIQSSGVGIEATVGRDRPQEAASLTVDHHVLHIVLLSISMEQTICLNRKLI